MNLAPVNSSERGELASLIKSCGEWRDLEAGRRVHDRILQSEHNRSRYLSNLLIEMYGKCGNVQEARSVYHGIPKPNVFTGNIMIAAYARNGFLQEAREVFNQMAEKDVVSWTAMITAYARCGKIVEAQSMLNEIPFPSTVAWNSLLSAHAENGDIREALIIFKTMPVKDLVSWNALMSGYVRNGCVEEARELFDKMPRKNVVSWNALVSALAETGKLAEARTIFEKIPLKNTVSWNAMIRGYIRCGCLNEARELFDRVPSPDSITFGTMVAAYSKASNLPEAGRIFERMPHQDIVTWNSLLAGHASQGNVEKCEKMFRSMPWRDKMSWTSMLTAYINSNLVKARDFLERMPICDSVALTVLLQGYARRGYMTEAREMFERIRHEERDAVAWNSMISAYVQNGQLYKARELFEAMPHRDTVSWTSMISGYSESQQSREALQLFAGMDLEGLVCDKVSIINAMDACTSIHQARTMHKDVSTGHEHEDVELGTTIVTMYGRCGSLEEAKSFFDNMKAVKDTQCWNAMLTGYAQRGHTLQAMELVRLMSLEGVGMDRVTVLSILSSCSHSGLFQCGHEIFLNASGDFSIEPTADLFGCMVDLLGRAGWMDQAQELVNSMPFEPDIVAWTSLMAARKIQGASQVHHKAAAERLLDSSESSSYVILSSIACK